MRRAAWMLVVLAAIGCGKSDRPSRPPPSAAGAPIIAPPPPPPPVSPDDPRLAALLQRADAIIAAQQPKLDDFAARIEKLKHGPPNLPGWERILRIEQLADDTLGLWPFENLKHPGPEWKPNPPTLLGMGPYVHEHGAKLAAEGRLFELQRMVDDMEKRYADGEANVEAWLGMAEIWLITATTAMHGTAQ